VKENRLNHNRAKSCWENSGETEREERERAESPKHGQVTRERRRRKGERREKIER
jgi:hypothetical protein